MDAEVIAAIAAHDHKSNAHYSMRAAERIEARRERDEVQSEMNALRNEVKELRDTVSELLAGHAKVDHRHIGGKDA